MYLDITYTPFARWGGRLVAHGTESQCDQFIDCTPSPFWLKTRVQFCRPPAPSSLSFFFNVPGSRVRDPDSLEGRPRQSRGGGAGQSQVVPLRVPLRVQGILIESILIECSVVEPLTTSQRGTGAGQRPRRSGPSGGPSVPLPVVPFPRPNFLVFRGENN